MKGTKKYETVPMLTEWQLKQQQISRVYPTVPSFTEDQLEKQLEKQITFLKTIYPWLSEDEYQEGAIELRPIKRGLDVKYVKSYTTWRLEQKDINKLREFLKRLNGQGYCLYYSLFTLDYNKETGKQKGKINSKNALYTSILGADFDDITLEEFQAEKQKLNNVGLETLDIYTGHGVQSLILLKDKVYDKGIVRKYTELLISKGFKVDANIVDCSRVFRMPYSFNCKSLDPKNKHYGDGVKATTNLNWSETRYHLEDVFNALNKLPTVVEKTIKTKSDTIEQIELESIKTDETIQETATIKEIKEIKEVKLDLSTISTLYDGLVNIDKMPEPIQKMLQGTQQGLRNNVMLFIIPFFRNTLGYSISRIKRILTVWGNLCTPVYEKQYIEQEVERIFNYGFKGQQGKYTTTLRQAYGYLEFNKFTKKNKIIIPNSFFDNFNEIKDGSIKIYLALKLKNKVDNIKNFTKKSIQEITNISEKTLERNIKDLVAKGYVCKTRSNRRQGEKYIYYINPYFSAVEGFTMLENAVVQLMLDNLTDGEIKLYSYLCFMIGNTESECWASQKYLAKQIGKKQNAISMMTDNLQTKKYITKKTIDHDGMKHCIYNLNY